MLGAPRHDGDAAARAREQDQRQDAAAAAAGPSSPRGLVLACAGLLHRGDVDGARRAAAEVLSTADPRGDAADRLAHHFGRALACRVDGGDDVAAAAPAGAAGAASSSSSAPGAPSATAYLAYNQIAPFLRFAHLTANQAILDAAASGGARRLHIVDLDAEHGVQWPPLLQAIADRADPDLGPPEVRITGAGPDRNVLLHSGSRLGPPPRTQRGSRHGRSARSRCRRRGCCCGCTTRRRGTLPRRPAVRASSAGRRGRSCRFRLGSRSIDRSSRGQ